MYIESYDFGTPSFDEALSLRNDILRVPLGLEFFPDDISAEWDSFHLGAYSDQNELQACLVLQPIDNKEIKMRQVAVAEAHQGKGIGTALVEASEAFCKEKSYTTIVLSARKTAVKFYQKQGYKKKGRMYEEVGIPHYKMYKNL